MEYIRAISCDVPEIGPVNALRPAGASAATLLRTTCNRWASFLKWARVLAPRVSGIGCAGMKSRVVTELSRYTVGQACRISVMRWPTMAVRAVLTPSCRQEIEV